MKSFCLGSTLFLIPFCLTLANVALAQGEQLTSKGTAENVNQQRPDLPAVAANTPAGRFGDKSQLTISSDAGLEIATSSVSGIDGSTTTVTLRPAVDYFIANNLSLGGFIGLDYTRASGSHATTFAIGPRVGYNLAFSDKFSVWPKLGFSYSTTYRPTWPRVRTPRRPPAHPARTLRSTCSFR